MGEKRKAKEPVSTEYFNLAKEQGIELPKEIYDTRLFQNMFLYYCDQKEGFTTEFIAERAEISVRSVQRYRASHSFPDQRSIIQLAMVLELSLEDANRLLKAANLGLIQEMNHELSIIKKYYDGIVEAFKQHRKDSGYVNEEILKMNKELKKAGYNGLFCRAGESKYEELNKAHYLKYKGKK